MTLDIKIPRAEFARGLGLAARIAKNKSPMPMLSNVLLRANKHSLLVAATDLDVSLSAELACDVKEPGGITINASDLHRFVSGARGDDVTLKVDGSAWSVVQCGKSKYRIAGLAERDFPKVLGAAGDGLEVDAETLKVMLDAAGYAVSPDESRQAMCGVLFEIDGTHCTVASTDGHRLAMMTRPLVVGSAKRVPVSARGCAEIAHLLDGHKTCRVALADRRVSVRAGDVTISAGLLAFEAPQFRHAIPKSHKASAIVDRDNLLAALKRVSPLTGELNGVRITSTKDGLSLLSYKDGAEIADEVGAEIAGEIRVCVNAKYVTECLSRIAGDTVTIRTIDEMAPIVFLDNDDPGFTGIVMPMRM